MQLLFDSVELIGRVRFSRIGGPLCGHIGLLSVAASVSHSGSVCVRRTAILLRRLSFLSQQLQQVCGEGGSRVIQG